MWKKRKEISGVSASTLVGLKAEMAKAEVAAKKAKTTGEKKAKPVLSKKSQDLLSLKKNKGVEDRAQSDEVVVEEEQNTWELAEMKLREKSDLYEKMVKGEVLDPNAQDSDKSYLVDFEQKTWEEYEKNPGLRTMRSADIDMETERRAWEDEREKEIKEEEEKSQKIRMAQNLEQETRSGRKKIMALKEKRKQENALKLKRIKERQAKAQESETTAGNPQEEAKPQEEEETEQVNEQPPQIEERDIDDFLRAARLGLLS